MPLGLIIAFLAKLYLKARTLPISKSIQRNPVSKVVMQKIESGNQDKQARE
jgi:hypothetical protein